MLQNQKLVKIHLLDLQQEISLDLLILEVIEVVLVIEEVLIIEDLKDLEIILEEDFKVNHHLTNQDNNNLR